MRTELIDHSQTRKELKIEIEAAEVRAEYDRVSQTYASQASVPGFRKGHAPVSVIRTRFKNEIRGDVVQNLIPRAINDAINERGLNVLGEPEIHLEPGAGLEKMGEAPIEVHAHVEVMPEVALGTYKGLEVGRRVRPVTDETVERMLDELREQSASLQPVEDRGAEAGDIVTVNFVGKHIEPPSDEDINVEDVEVLVGGEGVLQDFTDQLTGTRADDVKTFRVKYPEDFSSKGLAGKEIEYTATVTAVRRKELPEADDEWARSFGEEIDSVATLRAKMREQLTERSRMESEHRLRDELMRKLTLAHEFELPDTLVDYQSRQLLESTVRDMARRGVDPRNSGMNWEGMQEVFRARAEEDLRGSLLLERIADEENIEPTDEEISQEIEAIAAATRQTPEQVRAALTKQGGERSIADRLRHRRALDLLVENARVMDEEWREDEVAEAPGAAPSGEAAPNEAAPASQGESQG
ncbi:MAG: trigger factor [Pyrinomonadaceae bacterium]